MVQIEASPEAWAEFEALVRHFVESHRTHQDFQKQLRVFVLANGWEGWFPMPLRKSWYWREAGLILTTMLARPYSDRRHWQLRDGRFPIWVYKMGNGLPGDCPHHHWELGGLPLRADHPFWHEYFPPNGWNCSCGVYGAHSVAGIRRVGGDPEQPLPGWYGEVDAETGVPVGIEPGFRGMRSPDLREVVHAILDGTARYRGEGA